MQAGSHREAPAAFAQVALARPAQATFPRHRCAPPFPAKDFAGLILEYMKVMPEDRQLQVCVREHRGLPGFDDLLGLTAGFLEGRRALSPVSRQPSSIMRFMR